MKPVAPVTKYAMPLLFQWLPRSETYTPAPCPPRPSPPAKRCAPS